MGLQTRPPRRTVVPRFIEVIDRIQERLCKSILQPGAFRRLASEQPHLYDYFVSSDSGLRVRKHTEEPEEFCSSGEETQNLRLRSASLRALVRNKLSQVVAAIRHSRGLQPLHKRYGPFKYRYLLPAIRRIEELIASQLGWQTPDALYQQWAKRCEELRYNRDQAVRSISGFAYKPIVSIIFPVYNTNPAYLRKALDSVLNQYYPNWELCVCDDGSSAPLVRGILKEYAAKDTRIRTTFSEVNQGIALASNHALSLATGEFIGLLDHDDELTPDALYEVVTALQQTAADLIYSDEDRLVSGGRRSRPHFKPAWCPDLLLSCMYLAHFCVYRRAIVERIGGFRPGFEGSQDYDLALRFTETTNGIIHIPKILYHWRDVPLSASAPLRARPAVQEAGRLALSDAMRRRRIVGEVECQRVYGFYRVKRAIKGAGRVSIIILVPNELKHLRRCVDSIESKTDYSDYEIILVHDGNPNAGVLEYLKRSPHRVIHYDSPHNVPRLNNLAARDAGGDYLLFLNTDTEIIRGDWLGAMVEHGQRPEVGAVGAKLLYPDGRIQHAGILLSVGGATGNAHRYVDGFGSGGYLNYANIIRNYSAVSAACLMVRRELFLNAGGFDEKDFAVVHSDVDLCLCLREQGYLVVYTPYAVLYRHESAMRRGGQYSEEDSGLRVRWQSQLLSDYYYNPNLCSVKEDFSQDFTKPESLVCGLAQGWSEEIVCRLDSGLTVGQEFLLKKDNLSAIAIKVVRPLGTSQGTLILHLRNSHLEDSDLLTAAANVSLVPDSGWQVFAFDPIRSSHSRQFYFFLELIGDSSETRLGLAGSANSSDIPGAHFENHIATRGSLSFRAYFMNQFR